ncbi:hypothetical protein V5J34_004933 [Endozoicomonas sp. NE35]
MTTQQIKFTACEHLDYSDIYSATCTKEVLHPGKFFWMRPKSYEGCPQMVQFCKKRGRLNNPEACLCERNKHCDDYKEYEHTVEIICSS